MVPLCQLWVLQAWCRASCQPEMVALIKLTAWISSRRLCQFYSSLQAATKLLSCCLVKPLVFSGLSVLFLMGNLQPASRQGDDVDL